MRIATKLFLFVGILVLVICAAIYLVPAYITSKQLLVSNQEYLKSIDEDRQRAWQINNDWLQQRIGVLEARIDAYLLLAAGRPQQILAQLTGTSGYEKTGAWLSAARLLVRTDDVSFLQVTTDGKLDVGITLERNNLHIAKKFPITPDIAWILMDIVAPGKPLQDRVFLGIWLPTRLASETKDGFDKPSPDEVEIYLFFEPVVLMEKFGVEPKLTEEEINELNSLDIPGLADPAAVAQGLLDRLVRAAKYLKATFDTPERVKQYQDGLQQTRFTFPVEKLLGLPQASGATRFSSLLGSAVEANHPGARTPAQEEDQAYNRGLMRSLRRIDDIELTAALGFLTAIGLVADSPFEDEAPMGAAHFLPRQAVGTSVLSSEVFFDKPLFNEPALLKRAPPASGAVPISSDMGFISKSEVGALTLADSLAFKTDNGAQSYLTLGASLEQTLNQLAGVAGEPSVLIYENAVINQSLLAPHRLSPAQLDSLQKQLDQLDKETGFITLAGESYYYSAHRPKENWKVTFVTLSPAAQVMAHIEQFERDSRATSRRLSLNILTVSVAVFVLALVVLEFISRRFTRPVRALAEATVLIREGRYDEVNLPDASPHSKDETAILTHSFKEMAEGLVERERIRSVLNKVVSKEIADEILAGKVVLGGEVREATVMFADIRNFTQLTEKLPPEEVITFVNSYMTEMTHIIERHQGVVDKYVGDSVMALFGAPVDHQLATLQAVLAGLVICKRIEELNERRTSEGLPVADVGVGIHCGAMVAGNMGAEDRLNYTVLGANVNLASRLCRKAEGMELLITEKVLQDRRVADTIAVEKRPPIQFKGFSEPMQVYRVVGLRQGFLIDKLSSEAAHAERELKDDDADL